jgi:hypothetical protein
VGKETDRERERERAKEKEGRGAVRCTSCTQAEEGIGDRQSVSQVEEEKKASKL